MARSITVSMPRAMFLLLPFGALLLKLTVKRPYHFYVVHLIWTLHVHTFVFLVVSVVMLFNPLTGTAKYVLAYPAALGSIVWIGWYMAAAFSRVYDLTLVQSAGRLVPITLVYLPVFAGVVALMSRSAF
jgi:hypothetical protein